MSRLLLTLGLLFLYIPMAVVVVFSFNDSKLVSVWGGFSTRWYGALWQDTALLQSALNSLKVGAGAATVAVILGTLAALALNRMKRFPGRSFFMALSATPLVLPEVILGFSLLLLYVLLEQLTGWPQGRGLGTVIAAHATLGMAYVTVLVQSRLMGLDPGLEEAAADLGATPLAVIRRIILPLIAPALIAGWLLAFTLSLDDLVIASFTNGPGASTLPMQVYSRVRLGISPQINALATLMLGLAFVVVAAVLKLALPHMKKKTT